ncbi:MAG: methyltransferase regulatory domain-containing protein [Rhodoferax sp.]|nr:methyltransferase regulatory domain-containing protein [Rhodoferax sp.]
MVDVGYTHGYYSELNPVRARFALLCAGYDSPAIETACELGFGQGISANFHAAGSTASWWGNDFNPTQAARSQQMARASHAVANWTDESFADFAGRTDLPEFDYIGLHGIWSWVSDANRTVLVDFIRRKLKVGGVLYISYNALPGWSGFAPVRHVLTQHATQMGAPGAGTQSHIDDALHYLDTLMATQPAYASSYAQVAERIAALKGKGRDYLAHEYFNRDWQPMHFSSVAEWLAPAKLQYACSAHYLDHADTINLTPEQIAHLSSIANPTLRETARDFMVNQQFRRDYWVKGGLKLNAWEQTERLRAQRLLLLTPRVQVALKVHGHLGEGQMAPAVYGPVLDALAGHQPQTFGQLEQAVQPRGVDAVQLLQAVLILCGMGHVAMLQDNAAADAARNQCDRLNGYVIGKALGGSEFGYLASPQTGGGVAVSRVEQLFLLAIDQGMKQPAEWAALAWHILQPQGFKMSEDGKPLQTDAEHIAALRQQAQAFAAWRLPVLRALQIAD